METSCQPQILATFDVNPFGDFWEIRRTDGYTMTTHATRKAAIDFACATAMDNRPAMLKSEPLTSTISVFRQQSGRQTSMPQTILTLAVLGSLLAASNCGFPPSSVVTAPGPRIIVHPQVLPIPTGQRSEFTVALSEDPGRQVVLSVSCIGGGCGFAVLDVPLLYFDSSNFAEPQSVILIDTGFRGRGQSIFQVTGDDLDPATVLVIRD